MPWKLIVWLVERVQSTREMLLLRKLCRPFNSVVVATCLLGDVDSDRCCLLVWTEAVVQCADCYWLSSRLCFTSCCSSVVERGIAVSATILRSVVRPSVAASLLPQKQRNGSSAFCFAKKKRASNKADRCQVRMTDPSIAAPFDSPIRRVDETKASSKTKP